MPNRVLLGAFANTYVLRVSRPGYEVTANLGPEGVAFDSRFYETTRIIMSGVVNFGAAWSVSVSHGQGFVPMALFCYIINGGAFYQGDAPGLGSASIGAGYITFVKPQMNPQPYGVRYVLLENPHG